MENKSKEIFALYEEMFHLHVGTKTNDTVFHKASEAFYETLFDVAHQTDESMQDSKQASPIDPVMARKRAYEIIEEAKSIVEGMVNSNKDMAVDNVLRGLVDKLGFDCGNARALCPCNKDSIDHVEGEEPDENEAADEDKEDKTEEVTETPEEESSEEAEEDLVWESMKWQNSWYKISAKEEAKLSKEDELNKKRKGSSEYTVVSIMP